MADKDPPSSEEAVEEVDKREPQHLTPPSWGTSDPGWDISTLFTRVGQGQAYSVVKPDGGATTASIDMEELVAAARAELRHSSRKSKLPDKERMKLAADAMEGEQVLAERIAAMMAEAGLTPPEVTLEYRGLSVEADALVGSAGVPSLGNVAKGMLKRATCQGGLPTRNYRILKDLSGVLRPGTSTLLLGPPGAGKSVFLQALSGRLQGGSTRVTGSVRYNGVEPDQFDLTRTVALVGQYDHHIPSMTVLETHDFAWECQNSMEARARSMAALQVLEEKLERDAELEGMEAALTGMDGAGSKDASASAGGESEAGGQAGKAPSSAGKLRPSASQVAQMRQLIKTGAKPHLILNMLGLSEVADTIVGDAMTRGISGGQRKRVTTGEVLVGPQAVVLMDEISTGLDSATTFSVVQSFVKIAHAMRRTFVISLLQPPPEVVQLFDDILLLTDGRAVYHGPVSGILPFFESQLQFVCPVRKDAGSFLQEVTTPVGQYAYAAPALLAKKGLREEDREPVRLLAAPPTSLLTPVEDMEAAFWKGTEQGRGTLGALEQAPFDPSTGHPEALATTRYASGVGRLTKLVFKRQLLLNGRDRAFYIARAAQAIVIGLVVASLFVPIDHSVAGGRQVMALASLSCQSMAMMSAPQIGLVFANKRVFYKQRSNNFFPPASYVISFVLTQLPASTVECTLYSLLVYWIVGLFRSAGNFFCWLAVLWSLSNCMAGFYRLLAYAVPTMVVANAAGGLALLFLMITNGFCIVRDSIPDWLIWVYWINPLSWAVRGIVANELGSPAWDIPITNTQGASTTVGKESADQFDFFLGAGWVWGSVALSWGWLVLFTIAGAVALQYSNPASPRPTVSDEDSKAEVERSVLSTLSRSSMQPPSPQPSMLPRTSTGSGPELPTSTGSGPVLPTSTSSGPAAAPAAAAAAGGAQGGAEGAKPAGDVVPFTPITLVCRDIRYYVADPSQGKAPGVVKGSADEEIEGKLELLKGISMYAEPGTLTALMGGSGAGKTTLMDVILGRKTVGLIRGDILVNGHPKVQATWSRVAGYVEQQDIHSAGTTVREALVFSARLRLAEDIGWEQVQRTVDSTLAVTDLTALAGAIVGEPGGEGLSVEQRKRLSIAVELVANPSVVFMDEPTSGLDARAAAIVMRAVKNVSLSNRTCVVTIHQPSMDIFESFDQLVLLQRGGRLTYFGALGAESSELVAYLEGQPGVDPIRPGYNPATWMLEVTGGSMSTTFKAAAHDFPTLYADSALRSANVARMEALAEEGRTTTEPLSLAGTYAASRATQRNILIKKWIMIYWRSPNYNFVRLVMTVAIAVILGLVYLGQGELGSETVSVSTVQNIMGLIFVLNVFLGMFNCMTVQPLLGAERTVFYRERSSSFYAPAPYAIASGIVELPYLAVQSLIMVVITYWMVGFEASAWKFFYFLLMYFLSLTFFTFFGQALVFATPNQLLAQLLSGFLNQMFSFFAGFMVPYPSMPVYWQWMNRLSPTTWILYGLAGSQLCDSEATIYAYNGQPTTVSAFMEASFGYTFDMVWWCCLIVAAYCIFFRVLSTFFLARVNYQRR